MSDTEDDNSSGWNLTESDPAVFSELLKTLGVPLIVDDLYSLDPAELSALQPLHALIFLFKWIPSSSTDPGTYDADFGVSGFFAHQVVNNACATLAVLNALGNIPSLPAGRGLTELFSFTSGLDPRTRGEVITSSDWLREAHNKLSPPTSVSLDGLGLPKSKEDAFHFVVYLPSVGALYELDGLKPHPVSHGAYEESGEGWVKKVREVIEARISTYPAGALEFNLLALRTDPLPGLQAKLEEYQKAGNQSEAAEIIVKLANENSKRERWAFENSLRKHNHIGMAHALLLALAKAGKLNTAKDVAKKKMEERIAKRKAEGREMDED